MIHEIQNTYLRRLALCWTVSAYIVCIGPLHLILAVLEWVERECDCNLRDVWDGTPLRKTTK